METKRIKQNVPNVLRPVARGLYRTTNRLLARYPKFAIIGTGRCGTGFTSASLTRMRIPCSHEGFFTYDGPRLRNPERLFLARGDASWMAVPFVGQMDIRVAHQVRHPFSVIKSFYSIGFFDPAFRSKHKRHLGFAMRYFDVSGDPLDNCLRWYVEWNRRCEDLTDFRFRVEDFDAALPQLLSAIGESQSSSKADVSSQTNSRSSVYGEVKDKEFREALSRQRAFPLLEEIADRYGYSLA